MLDEQIHEAHLELQKVEQEAKQLETRLRGIQSGSAEAKRLAKAKAQEAAERLMARTEQLREQNELKREQNYQDALAGYNRLTNRMLGQ